MASGFFYENVAEWKVPTKWLALDSELTTAMS